MATITGNRAAINPVPDAVFAADPDLHAGLVDNPPAFVLASCLAISIAVIVWLVMAIAHQMSGNTWIQAALRGAPAFGGTLALCVSVIGLLALLP
ncbi:hypothetical protein [Nocardia arthritidis]|uniref:hypothetical protein n=1 Tax=Nocardia arthritidis TaxID=228602 RepID=UPI0007A53F52|nr:hypothetical protein [Nocardia arthritidis]